METARWIAELAKWAIETGLSFLNGDDGPEPKRLVEALPPKLRADAEHLRQKRLLEAEVRADLDDDLEEDSRDDDD
jgi:hypothetical protein